MTNYQRQKIIFDMLSRVYFDKAFCGIALNEQIGAVPAQDKPFVTKVFYGVLEKNNYLDCAVKSLVSSSPKPKIALILKIGLYQLYFTSQPAYAVVSASVELTKSIGKRQLSGFVNAVLKNYQNAVFPDKKNRLQYVTVFGGTPQWLSKKLLKQYGFDFTMDMLTARLPVKTHIRVNTSRITPGEFQKKYDCKDLSPRGYYVTADELQKMDGSDYIVQSLASIYAAEFYIKDKDCGKVLDVCAAPGGKSVFMAQAGNFDVTSCDLYPHRVKLIEKYAANVGVKITALQNDAEKLRDEWKDKFDIVVCDVPCSGLGVFCSKPDVFLHRTQAMQCEIVNIQKKILQNAACYVRPGGRLCYSTCTILHEENQDVVSEFLNTRPNFETEKCGDEGVMSLYPQTDGCDGFFVARMRRLV